MLVAGIDPGDRKTGVAWIRTEYRGNRISRWAGIIFATQMKLNVRFAIFRQKLEGFFKTFVEEPFAVAVETPHDYKRDDVPLTTILRLHGAYAVICAEVARVFPKTILFPVPPGAWNGGMTKSEIWQTMEKKYEKNLASDDAADALGLADYAFTVAKNVRNSLDSSRHSV